MAVTSAPEAEQVEHNFHYSPGVEARRIAPATLVSLLREAYVRRSDGNRPDAVTTQFGNIKIGDDRLISDGSLRISDDLIHKRDGRRNVVNLRATSQYAGGGSAYELPEAMLDLDAIKPDWPGRSDHRHEVFDEYGFRRSDYSDRDRKLRMIYTRIIFAAGLQQREARLDGELPGSPNVRVFGTAARDQVLGAIALDNLGPQAWDLAGIDKE